MPTLQELKSQIAELQHQATAMHERESADAIATVTELISKYGLTAEQIGLSPARGSTRKAATSGPTKSSRSGAGVPKYADPDSSKTWTGFGKPPAWIAGAADRAVFLIKGAPDKATAPRKAARKKASRRK